MRCSKGECDQDDTRDNGDRAAQQPAHGKRDRLYRLTRRGRTSAAGGTPSAAGGRARGIEGARQKRRTAIP